MRILLVALTLVSFVAVAGAAEAKKPPKKPKKPPLSYIYTVEVHFTGTNTMQVSSTQTGAAVATRKAKTGWDGESGRFVLINLGSKSKPLYLTTTLPVLVHQVLFAHSGTSTANGAACQATIDERPKDGSTTTLRLGIGHNILLPRFTTNATVIQTEKGGCGTATRECPECLDLEPDNAATQAWWSGQGLGGKTVKMQFAKARLGTRFKITVQRTPEMDPSLSEKIEITGASGEQWWNYEWTFTFHPIGRVR